MMMLAKIAPAVAIPMKFCLCIGALLRSRLE